MSLKESVNTQQRDRWRPDDPPIQTAYTEDSSGEQTNKLIIVVVSAKE